MLVGGLQHFPALRPREAPPAHAYLYLDAYDARFECLIAVPDLMRHLGKDVPSTLSRGNQALVVDAAQQAGQPWLEIKLDGKPAPKVALTGVNLVKGVPGRTERAAPDELLITSQTLVGFTWEMDLETIPQTITITWKGFDASGPVLPVTVAVGSFTEIGSQYDNFELKPDEPSHLWHNQGKLNLCPSLWRRCPLLPPPPQDSHTVVASPLLLLGDRLIVSPCAATGGRRRAGEPLHLSWLVVIAAHRRCFGRC